MSFESCTFDKCTVVVKEGAQVKMSDTHFKSFQQDSHPSGVACGNVSIFVTGSRSICTVHKGRFDEIIQVTTVRNGGQFTAFDLDINGVHTMAIEAAGNGTNVELQQCKVHLEGPRDLEPANSIIQSGIVQ